MITNANMTIYHKAYNPQTRLDEWERITIKDVYWYEKQAVSVGENGLNAADVLTVRIPVTSVKGKFSISSGDYVVRDVLDKDISVLSELDGVNKHLVTAVRDNRIGSPEIQHWKIEGK